MMNVIQRVWLDPWSEHLLFYGFRFTSLLDLLGTPVMSIGDTSFMPGGFHA